MESLPRAGRLLLLGFLRLQGNMGQHGVREIAMESADVGQNNPAVPLTSCPTLGMPPYLPDLL